MDEGLRLQERAWEIADRLNLMVTAFLAAWFRGARANILNAPLEAREWFERELSRPRLAQAPIQRRFLREVLVFAYVRSGELAEARRIAAGLGELPATSPTRNSLRYCAGEWRELVGHTSQALEPLRRSGNRLFVFPCLLDLARAYGCLGDVARAEPLFREAMALAAEARSRNQELWACSFTALFLLENERLDEAARCATRCRAILAEGGDWRGVAASLALVEGALGAAGGRIEEAEASFAAALDTMHRYGALYLEGQVLHEWGRALLRNGERVRAVEKLDAALAAYRRLGYGTPWLERVLADKLRAQGIDSTDMRTSIDAIVDSLGQSHPDFARHAAADGRVTLAFSDMEGFTEMTERLGDSAAHRVIQAHHTIVRREVAAHRGVEVELQGDGFLLAFADAPRAVRCAIALQRAFAEYSAAHSEQPIRVRIGLHTGEAIREADRFFGKSVILAARIAAQARGGEILVSAATREAVKDQLSFLGTRETTLKGLSGRYALHAVRWESDPVPAGDRSSA